MGRELNKWVTAANRWLQAGAVLVLLAILSTALDREPPFEILAHEPIVIRAGSHAAIDVPVRRDMTRRCSAEYDRYLFDSSNFRIDLTTGARASAKTIADLEADKPGRLAFKFAVPPLASASNPGGVLPGPGKIVTDLSYECAKGHLLFPIVLRTVIPVEIVP